MRNYPYLRKEFFRAALVLILSVLLMKYSNGYGFIVVAIYALQALVRDKPASLFYSLTLTLTMMVANTFFVPKDVVFFTIQRTMLVIIGLFTSIKLFGGTKSKLVSPFMGMFIYLFYMLFSSLDGWMPIISLMKLLLFGIIYMAYSGMSNLIITDRYVNGPIIRSMFLTIAAFFIIGSLLLIPFPAISQMRYDEIESGRVVVSLFKGMSMHSQALGPIVSCIFVLLFADMIFSIGKFDLFYVLMMVCCPVLIYKTSSRTALGAAFSGIMFSLLLFMKNRNVVAKWRGKVLSVSILIAICLSVVFVFKADFRKDFNRYLVKSTDAENAIVSFETVSASRWGLVEEQWLNYKQSPLIGNGFQVSPEMIGMKISGITSLLSAPVEKGVWLSAVLEEGGAIGFILLLVLIVSTFSSLNRQRAYICMAVFFSMLVSNLGEFSMFAMSGVGGFYWGLVFVALILDSLRIKEEQLRMNIVDGVPLAWR